MDAVDALEGGIRRGLPRAWNYGGRPAVWLGSAGWEAARAGAVRGSARVLQGAEIAAVGTSWLGRRGFYDLARGYNATLGNRLGNTIAYGTGPAPYRPRPGDAGAPGPGRMLLAGAMGPLPRPAAWADRWPERRWAAPGLRLENAARFQRPALLGRYVPLKYRDEGFDVDEEDFDLDNIFDAHRTKTTHSFKWQWRTAEEFTKRVLREYNHTLFDYLVPFTDSDGYYTNARGAHIRDRQGNLMPAFTILNPPPNAESYVDIAGNILLDEHGLPIPIDMDPLDPRHPSRAEYFGDQDENPIGRVRERNSPPDAALISPEWYRALTGPKSEQAQQELLQLASGEQQIQFLNASEVEQEKLSKKLTKMIQRRFARTEAAEQPQTYEFQNDLLKGCFNLLTDLLG